MLLEPSRPCGPPRATLVRRSLHPRVRVEIKVLLSLGPEAEVAVLAARLGHDSRVVTAARQQEGDVRIKEQVKLIDRLPWRDMVGLGAHGKNWSANVGQSNRRTIHFVAPLCQLVAQK